MASARYLLGAVEEEERNAPMDLEEDDVEEEIGDAEQYAQGGGEEEEEEEEEEEGDHRVFSDGPSTSLPPYKPLGKSSEEQKAYSQRYGFVQFSIYLVFGSALRE